MVFFSEIFYDQYLGGNLNPAQLLKENKKGMLAIYKGIVNHLNMIGEAQKIELTEREPVITAPAQDVTVMGMLRFGSPKGSSLYALGYSDPAFEKIWKEVFPPKPVEPGVKSQEFELMKALFMALDVEFKAQGFAYDPKNAMIQEGETLGDWAKIPVEQVLRLAIGTKAGNLYFEIPLLSGDEVKSRTAAMYGFKEETRMLVVDDSMVSRKYSRSCLGQAGYFNVEECPDGQAALTKIMGTRPPFELIVADWHMPNMSGFELLKKVRALDEFKKLPFIMVTGEKNKDEVVSAIKEGASGYLVKPVAFPSFVKALKKASGRV